jgi:hypothetical protein
MLNKHDSYARGFRLLDRTTEGIPAASLTGADARQSATSVAERALFLTYR